MTDATSCRSFSAKDVSVKQRVTFQDHAVVIPIKSLKDCPPYVRRTHG